MDLIAQENLGKSVSIVERLFWDLKTDIVVVGHLEIIISQRNTYISVAKVYEQHAEDRIPLTSKALENLLMCREKDLKALEETTSTVQKLVRLFEEINKSMYLKGYHVNYTCPRPFALNANCLFFGSFSYSF